MNLILIIVAVYLLGAWVTGYIFGRITETEEDLGLFEVWCIVLWPIFAAAIVLLLPLTITAQAKKK